MRIVLTAFLLGMFTVVVAQENPGSATPLVLQDYLSNLQTGTCTTESGNLGSIGSGEASCTGLADDDTWIVFTAETHGVRMAVNSTDANLVLELLDAGLTSLTCTNAVPGVGEEVLFYTDLVPGDTYYLRMHSVGGTGGSYTLCAAYLPAPKVRDGWWPVFTPDVGLAGYRINQTIKRTFYGPLESQIQSSIWEFTDINSGEVFLHTVTGSNSQINLNDVGSLCFDRTYDVRIQLLLDGEWCGYGEVRQIYTEELPTTELDTGFAGLTYALNGEIKARFVGVAQELEWRLTTDNGLTSFTHNGGSSSWLYFDEVECIRHNKIYTVEVRAQYCGIWGPWSDPDFFITTPIPYTELEPPYCGQEYFQASILEADFLPVVDQYAWQFAPIEPGDPTMTPIGPAIVAYSEQTPLLSLLGLGLQPGGHYRVAVKPMLGYFDTCDDQQEGDYGFFCEISMFDPNALMPEPVQAPELSMIEIGPTGPSLSVYPNPVSQGILNIQVPAGVYTGEVIFQLIGISGQVVFEKSVVKVEDADFVQFVLPSSLPTGQYIGLWQQADGSKYEALQIMVK
jgi:hypothetical protein